MCSKNRHTRRYRTDDGLVHVSCDEREGSRGGFKVAMCETYRHLARRANFYTPSRMDDTDADVTCWLCMITHAEEGA